ncbi:MAG: cupin domain-containing protein [bacterium]|nr:cupin domain-containing protein [bacterium]
MANQVRHDSGNKQPIVEYWHLWVDGRGVTHQTRCAFRSFSLQSFAPPAQSTWVERLSASPSDITMLVLPAGWQGQWHRNPRLQWIIPLSGTWYVESMDGTRVEMGPGEASLGEDQDSRPDGNGREGHLSGVVGDTPAVLMLIQLSDPPTTDTPCGRS